MMKMRLFLLLVILFLTSYLNARNVSLCVNKENSSLFLYDNNANDSTLYEYIAPLNLSIYQIEGQDTTCLFVNTCCCEYTLLDDKNVILHFWLTRIIESEQCTCIKEDGEGCSKDISNADYTAILNINNKGNLNISFIHHNNLSDLKNKCKNLKKESLQFENPQYRYWSCYYDICLKNMIFFDWCNAKTFKSNRDFQHLKEKNLKVVNLLKNW